MKAHHKHKLLIKDANDFFNKTSHANPLTSSSKHKGPINNDQDASAYYEDFLKKINSNKAQQESSIRKEGKQLLKVKAKTKKIQVIEKRSEKKLSSKNIGEWINSPLKRRHRNGIVLDLSEWKEMSEEINRKKRQTQCGFMKEEVRMGVSDFDCWRESRLALVEGNKETVEKDNNNAGDDMKEIKGSNEDNDQKKENDWLIIMENDNDKKKNNIVKTGEEEKNQGDIEDKVEDKQDEDKEEIDEEEAKIQAIAKAKVEAYIEANINISYDNNNQPNHNTPIKSNSKLPLYNLNLSNMLKPEANTSKRASSNNDLYIIELTKNLQKAPSQIPKKKSKTNWFLCCLPLSSSH